MSTIRLRQSRVSSGIEVVAPTWKETGQTCEAKQSYEASWPAASRSDDEIVALKLRVHDAQSCVARAYSFASWADLRAYVEAEPGAAAIVRRARCCAGSRWRMPATSAAAP